MEPRILNFADAMELAKLFLSEKVEKVELSSDGIQSLLSSLSPIIYLKILCLLTDSEPQEIQKLGGVDLLDIVVTGLHLNRINSLLETYKGIVGI